MRLQIIVNLFAVIYAENIRNQRIIHCSRKLNIFRRFFAKNVEENVENRENPTFFAVLFPKMLRKMLRRFSLHYKYGVSGRNSEL